MTDVTPPLVPDGLEATLVLLRHGESQFIVEGRFQGRAETPLSPLGRIQASLAGARLARPHAAPALPLPLGRPLEIVHSPLLRTTETAEAVADAIAAAGEPTPPRRAEPGIAEIGQGDWEGLHHSEVTERWGDTLAGWRRRPTEVWAPGGESLSDVAIRVRGALVGVLGRLAGAGPRGTLDRPLVAGYRGAAPPEHPWSVLVGHDGAFKVVVLTLLDIPIDRFWSLSFPLAGITVIEIRGGRPTLRAHGLTGHLAPLVDEQALAATEARSATGAL